MPNEWQLIETAPRDGNFILIGWFMYPGQYHIESAFWHSTEKAWCGNSTFFSKDPHAQPTHWMSQPEPPEPIENGG